MGENVLPFVHLLFFYARALRSRKRAGKVALRRATLRAVPLPSLMEVAPTLPAAFARIGAALCTRSAPEADRAAPCAVQLTRLEVEVEEVLEPLHWLAAQRVYPRVYFSNQDKCAQRSSRVSRPAPPA